MKRVIPWILAAACLLWAAAGFFPRQTSAFNVAGFGRLPVLMNGRVQPFDSVARNSLLEIRNRQSLRLENGDTMSAMDWLLETMTRPDAADQLKVFRIDNQELLALLHFQEGQKYFSFDQIQPHRDDISREGERVQNIDSASRTAYERSVLKLYSSMWSYQRLKGNLQPVGSTNFVASLEDYAKSMPAGVAAVRARQAGEQYDEDAFNRLLGHLSSFDQMSRMASVRAVPPADSGGHPNDWDTVGAALLGAVQEGAIPESVTDYAQMASAYANSQPAKFNTALKAYDGWLAQHSPNAQSKGRAESAFNVGQLFYKATILYVLAFLGAVVFWFCWADWVRRCAVWLLGVAWILHTVGLVWRMVLEGRPPVTNLYSSAIFIGWGAVLFGLVLERIYRVGIGVVVAAIVGFATQIIALHLAVGGDTMEMMRAVLDTNFWLATHVVTITLGYSAMFVAGILATLYIVLGVFTTRLSSHWDPKKAALVGTAGGTAVGKRAKSGDDFGKSLQRMVYGIVCFATLFSFVGTVLGGIWADQSWGRFWGWDPKENGALLIVLWCATILHARWGGMIRARGLMNMAVFGNIITSFSWFGVNMLGMGLHSYGFMDSAFRWLLMFMASQAIIIGVGLLPLRLWRSFSTETPTPARAVSSPSPA